MAEIRAKAVGNRALSWVAPGSLHVRAVVIGFSIYRSEALLLSFFSRCVLTFVLSRASRRARSPQAFLLLSLRVALHLMSLVLVFNLFFLLFPLLVSRLFNLLLVSRLSGLVVMLFMLKFSTLSGCRRSCDTCRSWRRKRTLNSSLAGRRRRRLRSCSRLLARPRHPAGSRHFWPLTSSSCRWRERHSLCACAPARGRELRHARVQIA